MVAVSKTTPQIRQLIEVIAQPTMMLLLTPSLLTKYPQTGPYKRVIPASEDPTNDAADAGTSK